MFLLKNGLLTIQGHLEKRLNYKTSDLNKIKMVRPQTNLKKLF